VIDMKNTLLTQTKPAKGLVQILKKKSGRDNSGTISVRHQGKRQKRYYRVIDFKRDKIDVSGRVKQIEYDPNRNAHIARVQYDDGELRYILLPKDLQEGDSILSSEQADIKPGNTLPLKNIPVGIEIHNIELYPGQGGAMVRGAGSFATVLSKDEGYVQVKLSSGEVRKILGTCKATVGRVGNASHKEKIIQKAGQKIRMGVRPTVRGTAQNPRSHPHGGGEGRSGEGMHPKTPWGKKAKGGRTRSKKKWSSKLIVSRRK
jgi:large subunit ribosomal protein L2